MVKKTISFSIIILIIFLLYQVGINFLKQTHSIKYTIGNDVLYHIDEDFDNSEEGSYYLFRVTTEDNKQFVFEYPNNFNKQKKIVSEVKEIKKDGWDCISLIYKNKKESSLPVCVNNGIIYSYNYAKNLVDLSEFVNELPGIEKAEEKGKGTIKTEAFENVITVNKGYFDEKEVILVYNYKRVVAYYKDHEKVINFSNQDAYSNNLGRIVGKYYLVPRYGFDSPEIKSYIKYNIETQIKKEIVLPDYLSKDLTYVNGVYDGKLYVFDKSSMNQYAIDPDNDSVRKTGTVDEYPFAYINGEKTNVSAYEMKESNVTFTGKYDTFEKLDFDSIYVKDDYSIIGKDGNYYKVYNKYSDLPILLFNNVNAKEVKEKKGNVYFIDNDTIYKYNDSGLYDMVTTNELIYNSINVYDVY